MAAADRVTVLRDGVVVGRRLIGETNPQELAQLMVGREVQMTIEEGAARPGAEVLEIADLTVAGDEGRKLLDSVALHVRAGEILGVAGVDGNGQRELALAIAGLLKPASGRICIAGKDLTGRPPHEIIEAGARFIPEDRQSEGLVLDFSVAENLILKSFAKPPFAVRQMLQRQAIDDYARRIVKTFDVRTSSVQAKTADLSGGNQQKVAGACRCAACRRESGQD